MMIRCTLLLLEVLVTEVVLHEVLVEVHQENLVVHLFEVDLLGSPSSSTGAMSPFVPPGPVSTPPHPLPPNRILTYQRASQRQSPALDVIIEDDESSPTSITDARNKQGRGV